MAEEIPAPDANEQKTKSLISRAISQIGKQFVNPAAVAGIREQGFGSYLTSEMLGGISPALVSAGQRQDNLRTPEKVKLESKSSAIPYIQDLKLNITRVNTGNPAIDRQLNQSQGQIVSAIREIHSDLKRGFNFVHNEIRRHDANVQRVQRSVTDFEQDTKTAVKNLSRRIKKIEDRFRSEVGRGDFGSGSALSDTGFGDGSGFGFPFTLPPGVRGKSPPGGKPARGRGGGGSRGKYTPPGGVGKPPKKIYNTKALRMTSGLFRVLGPLGVILVVIDTGNDIYAAYDDYSNGDIDETEFKKRASVAVGQMAGGLGGAAIGGSLGALVGSVVPGWGTLIGGFAGSLAGFFGGKAAGGFLTEVIFDVAVNDESLEDSLIKHFNLIGAAAREEVDKLKAESQLGKTPGDIFKQNYEQNQIARNLPKTYNRLTKINKGVSYNAASIPGVVPVSSTGEDAAQVLDLITNSDKVDTTRSSIKLNSRESFILESNKEIVFKAPKIRFEVDGVEYKNGRMTPVGGATPGAGGVGSSVSNIVSRLSGLMVGGGGSALGLSGMMSSGAMPGSIPGMSGAMSGGGMLGGGEISASIIPNAAYQSASSQEAKKKAESYYGKKIDDKEWDLLLRSTYAEAGSNQSEQGMVMASILNRARGGNSITGVLYAENQFQAVTGTKYNRGPSPNFRQGPSGKSLDSILGSTNFLDPNIISYEQKNFSAASLAAYGPGTNPEWRNKILREGGGRVGQSVFNTVPVIPENFKGMQSASQGISGGVMPSQQGVGGAGVTPTYVSPVTGTFIGGPRSGYLAPRDGGRLHSGGDWQAANGSTAVFPIGGKVLYSGEHSGYGYMVDVLGDDGKIHRLAPHASVGNFKPGDRIEAGSEMGKIGLGHLHYEIIPTGSPVHAKMAEGGNFVVTSQYPGHPTLTQNPEKVFGLQRISSVTAGQPIGPASQPIGPASQPKAIDPNDPFSLMGFVSEQQQLATQRTITASADPQKPMSIKDYETYGKPFLEESSRIQQETALQRTKDFWGARKEMVDVQPELPSMLVAPTTPEGIAAMATPQEESIAAGATDSLKGKSATGMEPISAKEIVDESVPADPTKPLPAEVQGNSSTGDSPSGNYPYGYGGSELRNDMRASICTV